ncbi:hypothetical protein YpMG051020_2096 [Yersinia pestis biovar Orientalis str. MG05-1020]|nr:hypothetical protein YpMG051020_2096 [Yersinia pestis biovar Orientalis str. MG05-1020]
MLTAGNTVLFTGDGSSHYCVGRFPFGDNSPASCFIAHNQIITFCHIIPYLSVCQYQFGNMPKKVRDNDEFGN